MISIALATYNGEKYIREQLDSVLSQTIQDFELVICDDCSTDSTWSILLEYEKKDKRIRVCQNSENIGFVKNFEKAISLCEGDYIALSDQDDIWTRNHLEVLFTNIGDHPIVCGNAEMVSEDGKPWGYKLSEIDRVDVLPQNELDRAYRLLFFGNPYQGASMLICKKFFEYALPIPDTKCHDIWFAILACFKGGIRYVDEAITFYRQHDNNVTAHERWTLLKALKRLKPYSSYLVDRKLISKEVILRVKDLSKIEKDLLFESVEFHTRKYSFKGRLQNIPFLFQNYSRIYTTRSKSLLLPRLFKSLL